MTEEEIGWEVASVDSFGEVTITFNQSMKGQAHGVDLATINQKVLDVVLEPYSIHKAARKLQTNYERPNSEDEEESPAVITDWRAVYFFGKELKLKIDFD